MHCRCFSLRSPLFLFLSYRDRCRRCLLCHTYENVCSQEAKSWIRRTQEKTRKAACVCRFWETSSDKIIVAYVMLCILWVHSSFPKTPIANSLSWPLSNDFCFHLSLLFFAPNTVKLHNMERRVLQYSCRLAPECIFGEGNTVTYPTDSKLYLLWRNIQTSTSHNGIYMSNDIKARNENVLYKLATSPMRCSSSRSIQKDGLIWLAQRPQIVSEG